MGHDCAPSEKTKNGAQLGALLMPQWGHDWGPFSRIEKQLRALLMPHISECMETQLGVLFFCFLKATPADTLNYILMYVGKIELRMMASYEFIRNCTFQN